MTCSKIFSGDLPELTNEILQYFRNDHSTLHSCILVNRLWCRLAIPLLWEDPFSRKILKNHHFIEIYLHKLNDDDKIKLSEYGIIIGLFPSNTLFNYPNFIKCLNTERISSSIETWAENAMVSNFNQVSRLSSFIFLSLFKIFIENEVNLHTFEVEASYTLVIISNDCLKSVFQLILQNPNFICNIKNLTTHFYRLNSDLSSFLECFYSNCNLISSLSIDFSVVNYCTEEGLSKIINSQQNLKKIYF
jgi:hypothetical protein